MEEMRLPEQIVFGLDIGTRSVVGTVGYKVNMNEFVVAAQTIHFHETRAMMDGQIHDIGKVAETIGSVKRELERQTGRKLSEVCIAAAGRVLKTITVKTEYPLNDEMIINNEMIRSMELIGVEEAHERLREQSAEGHVNFYCVGYSVVHYYLGDIVITNLEGHKGSKIGAEVLATFLPEDVIDGLYAATDRAGLSVANLTLEPIAAINLAIPEKFRLLNLALVDVGAGTSDICITRDGSVTAYGMIPCAGDMITEQIMKEYLVLFATAEEMKLSLTKKKKNITYKDVMGIKKQITAVDLRNAIAEPLENLTKQIAAKIHELNGNKQVSAIFIVGGGGKNSDFTGFLAKYAKLPRERVALRGEEVLGQVRFIDEKIKKDPSLVTPIGICLNYYEQNNSFIFVTVNGEKVKLYDNGRLTCMDAALSVGFPNERLFPRRGKELNFTIDGKRRMIRGEAGESSVITINGRTASISSPIIQNDSIGIIESTEGEAAHYMIGQLPEYSTKISFYVNNRRVICPRFAKVRDELVSEFYEIREHDEIEILDHYTVEQLLIFLDIDYKGPVLVNNAAAARDDKVHENFSLIFNLEGYDTLPDNKNKASIISENEKETNHDTELMMENTRKKEVPFNIENKSNTKININEKVISIIVNNQPITMKGKDKYLFVDILDYYDFDTSIRHGEDVIMKINDQRADFTSLINNGDIVDLYWTK